MTKQDFNAYRFKGFDWMENDSNFLEIPGRINEDESKIIVTVGESMLHEFTKGDNYKMYFLKVDRKHLLFLKGWQVDNVDNTTFYNLVLDKNYWAPKEAKMPFNDLPEEDHTNWEDWLGVAQTQEKEHNRVLWHKG